jgi:large subunit ribosomal protein L32e
LAKKDVINDFTKIPGVGKAKAEALYNNGYDSPDKLKKANIKDLTKIEGITVTIAKSIIKQFSEEPKAAKKEKVEKAKIEKKTEEKPKPKKETKTKKEETKKKEKPKEIKEEKEEETETEEAEEEYKVKKKPKHDKDTRRKLSIRRQIKRRTPDFLREEWFRYKRLSKNWRRPDGISSKMRRNFKYRPSKVRVGFRGPKDVRGLHSSGFEEIIVYNVNDLNGLDPKKQAARIGSSVGTKKRLDIEKKAEELDVRILNL